MRETLFLALTRPALTWGVPFEALILNVMICFAAGVELQAPTFWRCPIWFWLMGIPIHLGLRQLTGWDYHWCRTLKLIGLTAGYSELPNLPLEKSRDSSEIPSSV
jgi:type IV secretory pathway VirB3-like protein